MLVILSSEYHSSLLQLSLITLALLPSFFPHHRDFLSSQLPLAYARPHSGDKIPHLLSPMFSLLPPPHPSSGHFPNHLLQETSFHKSQAALIHPSLNLLLPFQSTSSNFVLLLPLFLYSLVFPANFTKTFIFRFWVCLSGTHTGLLLFSH